MLQRRRPSTQAPGSQGIRPESVRGRGGWGEESGWIAGHALFASRSRSQGCFVAGASSLTMRMIPLAAVREAQPRFPGNAARTRHHGGSTPRQTDSDFTLKTRISDGVAFNRIIEIIMEGHGNVRARFDLEILLNSLHFPAVRSHIRSHSSLSFDRRLRAPLSGSEGPRALEAALPRCCPGVIHHQTAHRPLTQAGFRGNSGLR